MTALCCNECFLKISTIDSVAANIWLDMCAHFIKWEGNFHLTENRIPHIIKHIRSLEKLGFITTLDGLDAVTVRVNGYEIVEEKDSRGCLEVFCINKEAHSDFWI